MVKDIRITIRLTAEEKERLKKSAEAEGLTLSDYVRKRLTGVRQRRRPQTEEARIKREWLYELNRIGVNLNQIARAVNKAVKEAPSEEAFQRLVEALDRLKEIEDDLGELLSVVKERSDAGPHR